MQLIFDRRVNARTPGRFRTRALTEGVIPSLHVDYKSSRIKQYFKQVPGVSQVGARTETTDLPLLIPRPSAKLYLS